MTAGPANQSVLRYISRQRRRTRGRECAAGPEPSLISPGDPARLIKRVLERTRLTLPVHVTSDDVDLDLVTTTATTNRDPVVRTPDPASGTTGSDARAYGSSSVAPTSPSPCSSRFLSCSFITSPRFPW